MFWVGNSLVKYVVIFVVRVGKYYSVELFYFTISENLVKLHAP